MQSKLVPVVLSLTADTVCIHVYIPLYMDARKSR